MISRIDIRECFAKEGEIEITAKFGPTHFNDWVTVTRWTSMRKGSEMAVDVNWCAMGAQNTEMAAEFKEVFRQALEFALRLERWGLAQSLAGERGFTEAELRKIKDEVDASMILALEELKREEK